MKCMQGPQPYFFLLKKKKKNKSIIKWFYRQVTPLSSLLKKYNNSRKINIYGLEIEK